MPTLQDADKYQCMGTASPALSGLPFLPCAIQKHLSFLVQFVELLVDTVHKDLYFIRKGRRPANILATDEDTWYHEPGSHTRKVGLFKLLRELLCIIDYRGEEMVCAWERARGIRIKRDPHLDPCSIEKKRVVWTESQS